MIKQFFDFKRTKSLPEALVFYAVCVIAVLVINAMADRFMTHGGF